MPARVRFFVNHAPDYKPDEKVSVDENLIKEDILANVYLCVDCQKKSHKNIEGGLYTGTYGNAYTLLHLSKNPKFASEREDLLKAAVKLIKAGVSSATKAQIRDYAHECGFLSGKAGIFALGAAIFFENGQINKSQECINNFKKVSKYCLLPGYASFGGDELFVGRAGYLCGALWLNRFLNRNAVSERILHRICDTIVESGRKYSQKHRCKIPFLFHYYNTEYLGAAHGLSSILLMLLCCDSYIAANPIVENEIKKCVDFFVQIQMPKGNFPCDVKDIAFNRTRDELVHWCHGAPGIVYLMLKAFLKWNTKKYINSAILCGDLIWEKGLLKKGPGICHGICGNGYVFLSLFRVTKDFKYIHRANEFAKFFRSDTFKQARVPDNPFSLFEGLAGAICFLADLMVPEDAAFPFMDIF